MQKFTGKNVRINRPSSNFTKENATKSYVKKQLKKKENIIQNSTSAQSASVSYDSPQIVSILAAQTGFDRHIQSGIQGYVRLYGKSGALSVVRVMVIQYLKDSATAPTLPILFYGTTADANTVLEPYDFSLKSNYKILYNSNHILSDSASATSNLMSQRLLKISVPYKRIQKKIITNTSDAAAYGRGALYLVVFSNVAAASTPPTIDYDMSVNYSDYNQ